MPHPAVSISYFLINYMCWRWSRITFFLKPELHLNDTAPYARLKKNVLQKAGISTLIYLSAHVQNTKLSKMLKPIVTSKWMAFKRFWYPFLITLVRYEVCNCMGRIRFMLYFNDVFMFKLQNYMLQQ
jgi:hypothetical protein